MWNMWACLGWVAGWRKGLGGGGLGGSCGLV